MIILREQGVAKLNLYLHVTGKREDGYHLLDSLVAFADIGDRLEIVPSEEISLSLGGPFAPMVSPADNSILKAAEVLRRYSQTQSGAAIAVQKHLPAGAGLGGGSADAAATLRLLMRFWKVTPPAGVLDAMALSLGADVPACLRSASLYMSGIGEVIENGPRLTGMPVVLVFPGRPLPTAEVFRSYPGVFSTPARHLAEFASTKAVLEFLGRTRNDLQETAIRIVPEIAQVLENLGEQKECMLARMSGSGSACFGLFATSEAAASAAHALAGRQPSWWIKAGHLL